MNPSRRATLAALVLSAIVLPACGAGAAGSGKPATEARTVAEFQAVRLSGSMDLQVRQGAQQALQVQADDNLLPLLETTVESVGGVPTLDVRWKRGHYVDTRHNVKVSVVLPRLSAVQAAGAGDIRIEAFTTPALKVSLSGSGDARFEGLNTEDLGISISGSGDVSGNGKATRLAVSVAGSGDVSLAELRAEDVSVSIAGSGDAAVQAHKTLDVSVAGSGDVTYTGNAAVKSRVAGSGSVTRR
jgi:hypothetical protein